MQEVLPGQPGKCVEKQLSLPLAGAISPSVWRSRRFAQ
jgi:hypothetical protein